MTAEAVEVLKLALHGTTLGYLTGYQSDRTNLVFDPHYIDQTERPTFTLTGSPLHPASAKLYTQPWQRQHRLHPVLSNLLPEGALRELLAQPLKGHPENEFALFTQLAADLPGALTAQALHPDEIPPGVLDYRTSVTPVPRKPSASTPRFSLAGAQMKFSMHHKDGRFLLSQPEQTGDWIIKTPSTLHAAVPQNEYTAMKLAELAGVNIPEIQLIDVKQLQGLPPINLPQDKFAYAIKRYDRGVDGQRIHTEDFAQVLFKYPHEKVGAINFEQIGKVLYQFTGHGLANVQQLARRLLVNILLGNGDVHLKNWSLLYADNVTAELAPAYDIMFTKAYIPNEAGLSFSLANTKNWYALNMGHLEAWAEATSAPWRAVKPHLLEVLVSARSHWKEYLGQSPMQEAHKLTLRQHWGRLHSDFKL